MTPAFTPSVPLGMTPFRPALHPARSAASATPIAFPMRHATTAPVRMVSETNIAAKAAKVSAVKTALDESMLIFSAPLDGLTVSQVIELKRKMPEGTTLGTVKNTLMRRAIADTVWQPAETITNQSTFWVFVREDMKASVQAYKDFAKDHGFTPEIRGGVFEGNFYDVTGVESVASLPTKKELITKIAILIKAVPTKIAKTVKAVPTKVGRAIKLAVAEEGDGAADGTDPPAAE